MGRVQRAVREETLAAVRCCSGPALACAAGVHTGQDDCEACVSTRSRTHGTQLYIPAVGDDDLFESPDLPGGLGLVAQKSVVERREEGAVTNPPDAKILDSVDEEVLAETGLVVAGAALIGAGLVGFGGWGQVRGILLEDMLGCYK